MITQITLSCRNLFRMNFRWPFTVLLVQHKLSERTIERNNNVVVAKRVADANSIFITRALCASYQHRIFCVASVSLYMLYLSAARLRRQLFWNFRPLFVQNPNVVWGALVKRHELKHKHKLLPVYERGCGSRRDVVRVVYRISGSVWCFGFGCPRRSARASVAEVLFVRRLV